MKIFILESLRVKDPKTGKLVHEFLDGKGIKNEYHKFESKEKLLDLLLNVVKTDAVSGDYQPFVHLDCHGNDNGIAVVKENNTEELITWQEIRNAFREIYVASKHKSVICMSSCQGFNVAKLVAYNEPCPYDHICGSFEKISFSDSYCGYTKFYELVFEGKSIYESAVEVHQDSKFNNLKFLGINANTLFKIAVDGYLENECTEERLNQRKEQTKKSLALEGTISKTQEDELDFVYSLEGQKKIIERNANVFFS